jgi:cell division septum initiation protein DivIVA
MVAVITRLPGRYALIDKTRGYEVSSDKRLLQHNVTRLSTQSVASDELHEQGAVLEAVEHKLVRMEQGRVKIREKIAGLRQQLAEARNLHKELGTAQTKRALMKLTKHLDSAVQKRDSILSDYRELKLLVRDQRALCKSLLRKEEARQKAVARFLEEWERRYDRETRMKEKNIRKRERLGKR